MKKTFLIVVTLMALDAVGISHFGPRDVVPAPVKYVTSGEGYSLKRDGSDIRVHLADRRFSKEIKGLNIPEFARDEAYRLTVGKKGIDIFALTETGVYRARRASG